MFLEATEALIGTTAVRVSYCSSDMERFEAKRPGWFACRGWISICGCRSCRVVRDLVRAWSLWTPARHPSRLQRANRNYLVVLGSKAAAFLFGHPPTTLPQFNSLGLTYNIGYIPSFISGIRVPMCRANTSSRGPSGRLHRLPGDVRRNQVFLPHPPVLISSRIILGAMEERLVHKRHTVGLSSLPYPCPQLSTEPAHKCPRPHDNLRLHPLTPSRAPPQNSSPLSSLSFERRYTHRRADRLC